MGLKEFQSEIKLEIDDPPIIITKDTSNRIETTTTISDDEGHKNEHSFSWILTRVHAGYFRITLSLCSQALLWKSLLDSSDMFLPHMLKPLSRAFILLWSVSLFTLLSLSLLYMLRCLFHFKMVKAEFLHHVGVNYLFAPFISWLLLLQSSPFIAPKSISYFVLWCVFVMPLLILDVKIYGQWFTKGKRYLSVAANPTSQISVIGNLVGARSAAEMGWNEGAVCLFSLGIIHYLVLFVTLYQRLTGNNNGIPALLRPVFFLFIAAPSMASLTWDSVSGYFGTPSKMLFFLSVFLFTSLVCRTNFVQEVDEEI
ncbi:S-type anion channel SLAH1-like isoform X1 [Papaver somniferum]|uniref:S-type anion channel SLAH1-like isoform X1 n=1 Tax=Papaver somniferum TaxID=3469 RepID=UPI000E6FAA71|nr:S-type anion channel SLAH1-like isoform X1 [Papaver somniferum]